MTAEECWDKAAIAYFGCKLSDAVGRTHRKYHKAIAQIQAYGDQRFREGVEAGCWPRRGRSDE